MAKRIVRAELVEVVVPAKSSGTRFLIPDLPNLRNCHIWGVQFWNGDLTPKSILSGDPVFANDVLSKSFLTLVNYGGKEFFKQQPVTMMQTIYGYNIALQSIPQEYDFKSFVGQKVNYPKSYIETAEIVSDPEKDKVFLFTIYYSLPEAQEKAESGFSFGKRG